MKLKHGNLLQALPEAQPAESVEALQVRGAMRVERIVSHGHCSPEGFWYDQGQDEWVCLLTGSATLGFEDGSQREMAEGDWLLLPARCRHRVVATSAPAVWLAVFMPGADPTRT